MGSSATMPRSLRFNALSLLIATIGTNIVLFVIDWIIVRKLGSGDHSRYALVYSIVVTTIIVTLSGLAESFGVRQIARDQAVDPSLVRGRINGLSGAALLIGLVVSGGIFALARPIAGVMDADIAGLLRLASIWPIAFAVYLSTVMIANGLEVMHFSAVNTLSTYGLRLMWALMIFVAGVSLDQYFLGLVVTEPVGAVVCIIVLTRLLRRHAIVWRPSIAGLRPTIGVIVQSIPFTLARTSGMILPAVLIVLLGLRLGDAPAVSFFKVYYALGALGYLLAMPMANALLPTLSRLVDHDDAATRQTASDAVRLALRSLNLLTTASFVVYCALGGWLLQMLYKPEYAVASTALLWVTFGVGFEVFRLQIDQMLIASRHVRAVAAVEVARYVLVAGWFGVTAAPTVEAVGVLLCATSGLSCAIRTVMLWRYMRISMLGELGKMIGVNVFTGIVAIYVAAWAAIPAWLVAVLAVRMMRSTDMARVLNMRGSADQK